MGCGGDNDERSIELAKTWVSWSVYVYLDILVGVL